MGGTECWSIGVLGRDLSVGHSSWRSSASAFQHSTTPDLIFILFVLLSCLKADVRKLVNRHFSKSIVATYGYVPMSWTMSVSRPALSALIFVVVFLSLELATGVDWPHWRGPTRDAISSESSGWPQNWPPKRLWSRTVGRGAASLVMVVGRLYVMG